MFDQSPHGKTAFPSQIDTKHFDLVVIGAGIAGLNALFAASEYLPKGASALLLDQKSAAGGMWTVAYDYVRLHQPHPMFTVGNMKWRWRKPKDYLATRDEVQSHLESCLEPIAKKLRLSQGFGQTVTDFREVRTQAGYQAKVTFHQNDDAARSATVTADQVIHAAGFNYQSPALLPLSSEAVRSVVPQDLRETLADEPGAPIFVVGGGKTGMDTILEVLKQDPGRPVTLLAGKGTDFFNRTRYLPTGLNRWTKGQVFSRVFHDFAMTFDGDNEADVSELLKSTYATHKSSPNQQYLYGLLSEDEHLRIQTGLKVQIYDYLVDVTDGRNGPCLVLRSGERQDIPDGSLIVNCTGNVLRSKTQSADHPCLSEHGRVLCINLRDSMHFLTSVSAFFLTHMHFRGLLQRSGFYMMDHETLFQKNRAVWFAASSTQAYLNQTLAVQALPMTLLDRCGLDFDRWYPLPRRLAALYKMKSRAAQEIPQCRRALDRVAQRFDVHCAEIAVGGNN